MTTTTTITTTISTTTTTTTTTSTTTTTTTTNKTEKTCYWIGSSSGDDNWCNMNCNHNPPHCPSSSCNCITTTTGKC